VWGGYSLSQASAALADAETKAPGAVRDSALASGVASAQSGILATPSDPRLWNTIAELRVQQTISGAAGGISPTLLYASAGASQHAAELAPRDAAAQARLAYVKSLQRDAPAAAAALAKSYDADYTPAPAYAQRRLQASGRAWSAMDEKLRARAIAEACSMAGRSTADREQVQRMRMTYADAGMALALDTVLADATCQPIPDVK
jgi:hypothetical protein